MNPCPKYHADLALLAAGVLAGSRHSALSAHAAQCQACRQYLAELAEICRAHANAAQAGATLEPSADFPRRLRERLRAEETTGERGWDWLKGWPVRMLALRWRLALPAAGAVLVLMLLASRNSGVRVVPAPDPLAQARAENVPDSTQLWLTYQVAVKESLEALDAVLAREASGASAKEIRVTAGMHDFAGLTE